MTNAPGSPSEYTESFINVFSNLEVELRTPKDQFRLPSPAGTPRLLKNRHALHLLAHLQHWHYLLSHYHRPQKSPFLAATIGLELILVQLLAQQSCTRLSTPAYDKYESGISFNAKAYYQDGAQGGDEQYSKFVPLNSEQCLEL